MTPIRPENKDRYPDNWPEIRQAILDRAGDCCEICGIRNHAAGYREPGGQFIELLGYEIDPDYYDGDISLKIIRVVLTVMHLDHQPENCDPNNLKAACQLCHNKYDAPIRAAGKKSRRRAQIERSQAVLKLNTQGVNGDSE